MEEREKHLSLDPYESCEGGRKEQARGPWQHNVEAEEQAKGLWQCNVEAEGQVKGPGRSDEVARVKDLWRYNAEAGEQANELLSSNYSVHDSDSKVVARERQLLAYSHGEEPENELEQCSHEEELAKELEHHNHDEGLVKELVHNHAEEQETELGSHIHEGEPEKGHENRNRETCEMELVTELLIESVPLVLVIPTAQARECFGRTMHQSLVSLVVWGILCRFRGSLHWCSEVPLRMLRRAFETTLTFGCLEACCLEAEGSQTLLSV